MRHHSNLSLMALATKMTITTMMDTVIMAMIIMAAAAAAVEIEAVEAGAVAAVNAGEEADKLLDRIVRRELQTTTVMVEVAMAAEHHPHLHLGDLPINDLLPKTMMTRTMLVVLLDLLVDAASQQSSA